MPKGIIICLVLFMSVLLVGCSSQSIQLNYEIEDNSINDYEIYHITVGSSSAGYCKGFSSVTIPIDDTMNVKFTYGCMGEGYFVSVDNDYMRFDEAVIGGYITAQDVLNSGYGYVEHIDSVTNLLDINIEDFYVTEIIIHELNGELSLSGSGEWDTSYSVELTFDDIGEYLFPLLVSDVNISEFCDNYFCILVGGQATVQIKLQSIEYSMNIHVYEDHLDIHLSNDEENTYHVYNIRDDSANAEALFELIINEHTKTNK